MLHPPRQLIPILGLRVRILSYYDFHHGSYYNSWDSSKVVSKLFFWQFPKCLPIVLIIWLTLIEQRKQRHCLKALSVLIHLTITVTHEMKSIFTAILQMNTWRHKKLKWIAYYCFLVSAGQRFEAMCVASVHICLPSFRIIFQEKSSSLFYGIFLIPSLSYCYYQRVFFSPM